MSEAEQVMAFSFLFSLMLAFLAVREREAQANIGFVALILLGNIVYSSLVNWANAGVSWRSFLFFLALGLGATVGGIAVAIGLGLAIPRRKTESQGWTFSNDPLGCGLAIIIGIALLVSLSLVGGDEP